MNLYQCHCDSIRVIWVDIDMLYFECSSARYSDKCFKKKHQNTALACVWVGKMVARRANGRRREKNSPTTSIERRVCHFSLEGWFLPFGSRIQAPTYWHVPAWRIGNGVEAKALRGRKIERENEPYTENEVKHDRKGWAGKWEKRKKSINKGSRRIRDAEWKYRRRVRKE